MHLVFKKSHVVGTKAKCFFTLETHNNEPADTGESVLKILELVNSPFLKVLFDGFNFLIDGIDMMKVFSLLKPFTILYHMKNYLWSERICVSLNKGDVDFTSLIRILKEEKYQGFISFEYFCDQQIDLIKESIDWIERI